MTLNEILKNVGLTDEQIEAVSGAMRENKIYTSSEENIDVRYGKLKTKHEALEKEHGESAKLIEQLKQTNTGNESLQGKIAEYEGTVATLQAELERTKVDNAVKMALISEKALDVDYLTYKLKESGELMLDKNGEVKGLADKLTDLKAKYPTQFETAKVSKVEELKLPETGAGNRISKEDFDKMGYQDRLKVFNEFPELYSELSKN